MTTRTPLLLALALAAVAGCRSTVDTLMGSEPHGPLAELSWLAGSWVMVESGNSSEEHWTQPSGGTMLGMNRTVINGRTVAFEYLRIAKTPQGVVYMASPDGRYPPTPFALLEMAPDRAVFENPDHDFPQRIIYHRKGGTLDVEIEGLQDGRTVSRKWSWHRTALDAMPP